MGKQAGTLQKSRTDNIERTSWRSSPSFFWSFLQIQCNVMHRCRNWFEFFFANLNSSTLSPPLWIICCKFGSKRIPHTHSIGEDIIGNLLMANHFSMSRLLLLLVRSDNLCEGEGSKSKVKVQSFPEIHPFFASTPSYIVSFNLADFLPD